MVWLRAGGYDVGALEAAVGSTELTGHGTTGVETIGDDPYLVATIGAAYVRGLEGSGIVATLHPIAHRQ